MIIVITNDGIYIKKKCSILEATFDDVPCKFTHLIFM